MPQRILSREHEELLARERSQLGELQVALARFDAAEGDQKTLKQAVARLDELFLLVVAGEFNAGKSAFINALVGQAVLEEGVTPTTQRIHLLKHGDEVTRTSEGALEVVTAPLELLRDIHIVDTPGTNAIHREHEALTREFVPSSDLVLFVTSADRPFTESERAFLEQIRGWGKKVVVVVNKVDLVLREEDVQRIESFITDNAHALLGFTPAIFFVSARQALAARGIEDGEERERRLEESRFPALERYLVRTLDEGERVRLKLLNPLGVGERLAGRYLEVVEGRRGLLRDDFATLEDVERQLEVYRQDLGREFRYRLADVEKVLHEVEGRGIEFFDDTVRLGRVFDLLNKERIKAEYERRVLADAPRQIETKVQEIIDWLVAAELRQWQAVMDHLARRKHEHADRIVGQAGGSFDYDRSRLIEKVGGTARRSIEGFDRQREAARLADSVQSSVAGLALLEVGAVGLGATVAALATSTVVDVTGLLAATTLAVLGFAVLPHRRQRAKTELRDKLGTLREELMRTLTGQFDEEVKRSLARIEEAMAPYTRFVRAEGGRLDEQRDELQRLGGELATLRSRIERLA
ncbi:MAG TPA: dynamin family protein [Thermoanaerobaculia bacterium]|nr:dynamin family protein [Thermoanaerobaculia bacterium]